MSATIETTPITGSWDLDTVHSTLGFAVKHMVVSTFRGEVAEFTSTLESDVDGTRLTGTGNADTITVRNADLDVHLKSPDFFDVANHPELTFRSTDWRQNGDALEVDGELSLRGVTRPVTLKGTIEGPVSDPYGNQRVGLELETTVDRTDYGIDWNAPLPAGGLAVANDVKLTAHFEFTARS